MSDITISPHQYDTDYTPFVSLLESLTQIAESKRHYVLAARVQAALDELNGVLADNS